MCVDGTIYIYIYTFIFKLLTSRRIYQRGNQNPYIEEEQTTQLSKEKVQKDKQRSTKHKTKDRVIRTQLKINLTQKYIYIYIRQINQLNDLCNQI